MFTICFTLNSPPFSINKAYYKRSFTRTKECRAWGDNILTQLQDPDILDALLYLKDAFCPTKHALFVSLQFVLPKNKYFTKKGEISRHSQDLTNVEKLLVDLIFDPRFEGRKTGKGEGAKTVRNLSLDDKYIATILSSKLPGDDYAIHVKISTMPLSDLIKE